MTNQVELARQFKGLHVKGDPLILFNIWDAGSAKTVQSAGAKAIATGSWGVAAAHGYEDGENLPLDDVLANLKRIVTGVELPVTLDFEAGYARGTGDVRRNITKVIEAGAVGVNFEDQIIRGEGLYSIEEQRRRIRAVREAGDAVSVPLFINGRTDIFLKTDPAKHEVALDEAVLRAKAYAESGADGFFVPGLKNAKYIQQLCAASPIPVNIMVMTYTPSTAELAELGVARVSYGAGPYRQVMAMLQNAGEKALSWK